MQGAVRTIKEAVGTGVEKIAQAATVAVTAPIATAYGTTKGLVTHTIKGVAAGIETTSGLSKKILGEAAETAVKGSDDIASGTISFTGDDGVVYERKRNPNWKEGDKRKSQDNPKGRNQFLYTADGQAINGKRFGEAQALYRRNSPSDIADTNAKSGAGFWDGLGEWAQDNVLLAAGIAGGVGVAGGALLFGDDDDY